MVLAMVPQEQTEEAAAPAAPEPAVVVEPLSEAQVGRIIATLQADTTSKAVWVKRTHKRIHRYWNRRTQQYEDTYETLHETKGTPVRRYSDEQIMQLLNLTEAEFKNSLRVHRRQMRRPYTQKRIYTEFCKWVAKNKKWPTIDDFKPSKGTGLCSTWTLENHIGRGNNSMYYESVGRLPALNPPIGTGQSALHWLINYYCVDKYDRLTPQLILSVPNVTVRRDLMTKYGIENLLRDGGGTKRQQDEFGILWQLPTDNERDNRTLYVEVVNSSPRVDEKTGELILDENGEKIFDHYFLRVNPNVFTAKAAVAWTFQVPEPQFNIIAQS